MWGQVTPAFVDVKEQLPSGLTLQSISASDGGACAGTLCQFGTVAVDDSRTVIVVALVGSDVTGVVTNTAAVDSVDNVAGLPVSTTATTTVNAAAVLSVTKVALNTPGLCRRPDPLSDRRRQRRPVGCTQCGDH
jgi:hypothetical protein